MTYALVFPGQGAQEVGMGRGFYDACPAARRVFDQVDQALGFPLSRVIFEGPEEELRKTALTQPAILTVSVAILEALREDFGASLEPAFVAGHSLGEYTALVAAGTLSVQDGARLVHLRGDRMQSAVPLGEGSMAAVLGLDPEVAREVCAEASTLGVCELANYNAPGQIVLSGAAPAVERASVLAKEKGASKVIPLKVSAPFHCALMRPVAEDLEAAFATIPWSDPRWPVVANVDAQAKTDVPSIRRALYAQTYSPVLWADGVQTMVAQGVEAFVEIGPGTVLSGLAKRCAKGRKTLNVAKPEDAEALLAFLRGGL